jgi:hypothetical protein
VSFKDETINDRRCRRWRWNQSDCFCGVSDSRSGNTTRKHRMCDRSSVGAVELFLVNLNDNGISERLVSGGWCLFWTLWSVVLLNISLHDSWYFASFLIKTASIPSPSSIIMSKRIRLSLSAQEKQSTDWSKCFICHEDKHEALK